MRRAAPLAGVVLAVLGAISVVEAARLKDDWQGARLMPAVVGAVLVALGAAHFLPSVRRAASPAPWPGAVERRRVVFVFGLLALYVLVLPALGFLPATALFVLVLVRFIGGFSWPKAIAVSAAVAIVSHVVFSHWLGMPLPSGVLGI